MAYRESELVLDAKLIQGDYLATDQDSNLIVDSTYNPINILLPPACDVPNHIFHIFIKTSINLISINVVHAGLIKFNPTFTSISLNLNNIKSLTLQSINSEYVVLSLEKFEY